MGTGVRVGPNNFQNGNKIAVGTRIFHNKEPILAVPTNHADTNWSSANQDQWWTTEEGNAQAGAGAVATQVALLNAAQLAAFNQLTTHPNLPPAANQQLQDVSRIQVNAFSSVQRNIATNRDEVYLVVYEDISKINHNCKPNAIFWGNSDGTAEIIASRDIPMIARTEIVIDYVPGGWLMNATDRKRYLRDHYGFTCRCDDCVHAATSSVTRLALRNLRGTLHLNQANGALVPIPTALAGPFPLMSAQKRLEDARKYQGHVLHQIGYGEQWVHG